MHDQHASVIIIVQVDSTTLSSQTEIYIMKFELITPLSLTHTNIIEFNFKRKTYEIRFDFNYDVEIDLYTDVMTPIIETDIVSVTRILNQRSEHRELDVDDLPSEIESKIEELALEFAKNDLANR